MPLVTTVISTVSGQPKELSYSGRIRYLEFWADDNPFALGDSGTDNLTPVVPKGTHVVMRADAFINSDGSFDSEFDLWFFYNTGVATVNIILLQDA